MGGTGRPLGKTFFLQCQRRHPELPKIPTYLPRYKTKMDKRSGFWQVDLTPNAQKLPAFITPQGRVFKWKVMPFT